MQEQLMSIPACFSPFQAVSDDPSTMSRSGQNVFMSVYRTKLADQPRLITVTWCKNLLLHGLYISVKGSKIESQYTCKVELKPWNFWKKHGSKRFLVDETPIDVFWDLRAAKFNGETEPSSDYYVAIVSENEVVLLLGNMKKEAYRKTRCRPALADPILVSRKEHIFGKKKFSTRVKFQEKGSFHEISIECRTKGGGGGNNNNTSSNSKVEPEMEIYIDGYQVIYVKHLQWKFRGNQSIQLNKSRIEVYWDAHDWLFCPGLGHALFVFKSVNLLSSSPYVSSSSSSTASSSTTMEGFQSDFCLFLYAWKVD